jgi:hypothetical protein
MFVLVHPCCVVLYVIRAIGKTEKGGKREINKERKQKKVGSMYAYGAGDMGSVPK